MWQIGRWSVFTSVQKNFFITIEPALKIVGVITESSSKSPFPGIPQHALIALSNFISTKPVWITLSRWFSKFWGINMTLKLGVIIYQLLHKELCSVDT